MVVLCNWWLGICFDLLLSVFVMIVVVVVILIVENLGECVKIFLIVVLGMSFMICKIFLGIFLILFRNFMGRVQFLFLFILFVIVVFINLFQIFLVSFFYLVEIKLIMYLVMCFFILFSFCWICVDVCIGNVGLDVIWCVNGYRS